MSTDYYTEPPIRYDDFIHATGVEVSEPPARAYNVDHKLVTKGFCRLNVYRDESGNARFSRCGVTGIEDIFLAIIQEFGVAVFDEYGMKFPGCSD